MRRDNVIDHDCYHQYVMHSARMRSPSTNICSTTRSVTVVAPHENIVINIPLTMQKLNPQDPPIITLVYIKVIAMSSALMKNN